MAAARPRTIALHLPSLAASDRLIDFAVPIAKRFGARLNGVHVLPTVVVYADATVSMGTEFIVAQQETFQADAARIEAAFREKAGAAGLTHGWLGGDAANEPTMRTVADRCQPSDVVICAQYEESIPAAAGYSPDEMVLAVGRPVIVVPAAGANPDIGRRILIGWNGKREAARVAFDTIALAEEGAAIRIATIDGTGEATAAALREALELHGLKVEVVAEKAEGMTVAERLFASAADFGADMLAIGAYSRSRIRETVFGGTSSRVLRDPRLPVLAVH